MSKKYLVGNEIPTENANWTFSGEVSENFDDHVSKSVPFYEAGHELIGRISDFFLRDNSTCYDFGCSTGDLIRTIDLCGAAPLVRLTSNDQNQIKRVMDAGAHGIIVTMSQCRML